MTLYDSSVLIDYLDGDQDVVAYASANATEAAKTTHLALYEVYLGELYTDGPPDFDAVEEALKWVDVVESGRATSRNAAEFMARLHESGSALSYRDGYIAASAWSMNERLATRDADFDTDAVRQQIEVDIV